MDRTKFYGEMMEYATEIYCAFDASDTNYVGMILFNAAVEVLIPLKQRTQAEWIAAVALVQADPTLCCSCCTPTADAFDLAGREISQNGRDPSKERVFQTVFVISDGVPYNNQNGKYAYPKVSLAEYLYIKVPQSAKNLKAKGIRVLFVGVPDGQGEPPNANYFAGIPDPTLTPSGSPSMTQCVVRDDHTTCGVITSDRFPIVSLPVDENLFTSDTWDVTSLIQQTISQICQLAFTGAPTTTVSPTSHPSSKTPSRKPTGKPSGKPTKLPTPGPSPIPTRLPTRHPSGKPSRLPTKRPTNKPTKKPTHLPSRRPSIMPTRQPTKLPTNLPTKKPSGRPTTKSPTRKPITTSPTPKPTLKPTKRPSNLPSRQPSQQPSIRPSRLPTLRPSKKPSKRPTAIPTRKPSTEPSPGPTRKPTLKPTPEPTRMPSKRPTPRPTTRSPTFRPSFHPTRRPTILPTRQPTRYPTNKPTPRPTLEPTKRPSRLPTASPSKPDLNHLDLHFLLDASGSMITENDICAQAVVKDPNIILTTIPASKCWLLFLSFSLNLAIEVSKLGLEGPMGWEGDDGDMSRGLRVGVTAFACNEAQTIPVVYDLVDLADNYDTLFSLLNSAAQYVYPQGGTCPSEAIDLIVSRIQNIDRNVRPFQAVVLLTDGFFYDMPYPKIAVQGLFHLDVPTFAVGIAIPSKNSPSGMGPQMIANQKAQLNIFTNNIPGRVYNLGADGFSVLQSLTTVFAHDLPPQFSRSGNYQFTPWCGFTTGLYCLTSLGTSIDYCHWFAPYNTCHDADYCAQFFGTRCSSNVFCSWSGKLTHNCVTLGKSNGGALAPVGTSSPSPKPVGQGVTMFPTQQPIYIPPPPPTPRPISTSPPPTKVPISGGVCNWSPDVIANSGLESTPDQPCASKTTVFGCKFKNFCCWDYNNGVCVPPENCPECVAITTESICGAQEGCCTWNSNQGLCLRDCIGTMDSTCPTE